MRCRSWTCPTPNWPARNKPCPGGETEPAWVSWRPASPTRVNNPLGVVLLYAPPSARKPATRIHLSRKDVAMIVEQADRCKKIVSGLLNFARQNKSSCCRPRLPTWWNAPCTACWCRPESRSWVEHQDPAALGRPGCGQIRQVLHNLLINAVAAMPAGGRLTVRSAFSDEQVLFAVEDTGVGNSQREH